MARPPRFSPGGYVYHVLNRANARRTIFRTSDDYDAFERVMHEALERQPLNLFAYTIMPNHWHFVVRPQNDGDLSSFFAWPTTTHTRRWHKHRGTEGEGHLYQGRFKSFPVQSNHHLLNVLAYVERNPLRAGLVKRSQDWPWGSLWRREHGAPEDRSHLSAWPIQRRTDWSAWLDSDHAMKSETEARHAVLAGRPFGDPEWRQRTTEALLQVTKQQKIRRD